MIETEIWKDIPGYENRYQGSSMGRIRSIMGKQPRYLRLRTYKSSPYFKVQLTDSTGQKKWYRVHTLIYITFFGPVPEGLVIDHINGVKTDNQIWNIRAVSMWVNCLNPNTRANRLIRYHRPGEFERRSAAQKRRFERPEQRAHILRIAKKGRETAMRNRIERVS